MSLPLITTPTFTDIVPSTKEEIEFRPFLVKEEKVLLMALESEDEKDAIRAIEQIFNNCIKNDIDVKQLASFDFEYLMLKLRAKSVGETIELRFRHDENDCGHVNDVTINLDDINVQFTDGHSNKVMITDKIGIVMKYPTIQTVRNIDEITIDNIFKVFMNCVDYIFDDETVYNEYSKNELRAFLENLNQAQFEKISNFFETMPKLKHEINFKCSKCGEMVTTEVEGLQSFFT